MKTKPRCGQVLAWNPLPHPNLPPPAAPPRLGALAAPGRLGRKAPGTG
jgi:hypothetical protein